MPKCVRARSGRVASVILILALTGMQSSCVHAPIRPANSASVPISQISFTAWAVPESTSLAYVQVRLAPHVLIDSALLTATSSDVGIHIQPASFTLVNLAPANLGKMLPHNPPPLGMTVLRTFAVHSEKPNVCIVMITLEYQDQIMHQSVKVHFTPF